ncbi:ribonuclease H-like domain-containing protein [Mycena floridula]|nr:ribonuclease H-like domain-containing protein [Mycena floridula]
MLEFGVIGERYERQIARLDGGEVEKAWEVPPVIRVAIVDYRGQTVLDTYVVPTVKVTDYRTATTGIQPSHLSGSNAVQFSVVQEHVAKLLKGNIVVGHSLWNDFSILGISHPAVDTRDVGLYQPFRNALRSPRQVVGLQTLAWQLMQRRFQQQESNPLENARAALDLYRTQQQDWETAIAHGTWPCALPPSSYSRCYK